MIGCGVSELKRSYIWFWVQGDADIFFPTDFQLLERLDHYAVTRSVEKGLTEERISTVVSILFLRDHGPAKLAVPFPLICKVQLLGMSSITL